MEATLKVPARALATVLTTVLLVVVSPAAPGVAAPQRSTTQRSTTVAPTSTTVPAAASGTTKPKPKPKATTTVPATTTTTTVTAKAANAVPKVVTYTIAAKGKVTTDLRDFARQVAETLADRRGWSRAGLQFKEVAKGGRFTVWLSVAGKVPSFGLPCSAAYSCRAGRNVVINEDRWRETTASWKAIGGSVREYRNLVVNHEVGHWLGLGHATCSRAGADAPVMQQQSKDLAGCVANAWPLDREVGKARVRN